MNEKIGWQSFVEPQRPSGFAQDCTEIAMKKNGLSWRQVCLNEYRRKTQATWRERGRFYKQGVSEPCQEVRSRQRKAPQTSTSKD